MSSHASVVALVRQLLRNGEGSGDASLFLTELGFCLSDSTTERCVATSTAVQLASALPNDKESVAAVFACDPDLRQPWLSIVAARLKEAGGRRDAIDVIGAIDQLGVACAALRELVPTAKLQSTGHAELETELFGAPADQAVAWPKLQRVIGATADLVEGRRGRPAEPLKPIQPLKSEINWCRGRLLQLPELNHEDHEDLLFVLSGNCNALSADEVVGPDPAAQAVMRWVLLRPWATLLAQVVFVQEAWMAEQISGRLTLELAEDQLANAYEPSRLDVVVTTADGDEILCGTLGELLRRVLSRLNVSLLGRPEDVRRLDELLAPVIHQLLQNKVWRFDPRGGGSGRPGFVIDDEFSTSCYRAFGSKYFYRGCSVLTNAIRVSCEQWAQEKRLATERRASTDRIDDEILMGQ